MAKNEHCAVVAAYGVPGASRVIYHGLFALQHRGQESSGIATNDGEAIRLIKNRGLVTQVYHPQSLKYLTGEIGIGHNRYPTSGDNRKENIQPAGGSAYKVAFGFNGTLPDCSKLEDFHDDKRISRTGKNDTGLMHSALNYFVIRGATLTQALIEVYPMFTGAFSGVAMTREELVAFRDPYGVRPLSIGRIGEGIVFASETSGLDSMKAEFFRDVMPGEAVSLNRDGLSSTQIVEGSQQLDIFEPIYFSKPDSLLFGKSIARMRIDCGKELAKQEFVDADMVIPVPDSGIQAAVGFAESSQIPLRFALVKNPYVDRTFIDKHNSREEKLRHKFNVVPDLVRGSRVVLVDDSIVRGKTMPVIINMLRNAGAREVHIRIASPPVKYPDFYGIDTPNQNNLVAFSRTIDEVRDYIGADSLGYLSLAALFKGLGLPREYFSTHCLTGDYPIDLGVKARDVKYPVAV